MDRSRGQCRHGGLSFWLKFVRNCIGTWPKRSWHQTWASLPGGLLPRPHWPFFIDHPKPLKGFKEAAAGLFGVGWCGRGGQRFGRWVVWGGGGAGLWWGGLLVWCLWVGGPHNGFYVKLLGRWVVLDRIVATLT